MNKVYRTRLEDNIYLRSHTACKTYRPYELLIGRSIGSLTVAVKVFKKLYTYSDNVYIYESGKSNYCIQIKEVFETLKEAQLRKKQYLKVLGGYSYGC